MKKNIYLILTILCIFFIILIQSTFINIPSPKKDFSFAIDKEKLIISPSTYVFTMLSLLYLTILSLGIVNLIILSVKKLCRYPLRSIQEKRRDFFLPEETASKLLFLVSFLVLITYILSIILSVRKLIIVPNFFIFLNIVLQTGVILIVLKYIQSEFLGFCLNKKHFIFSLWLYTTFAPIILASLLLNHFLTEKLGLGYSLNPVVELLFLVRNKFSLIVVGLQIILLAPLAEELFFRGFVYKLVRNRYKFLASAILTSLLFAFLHRTPQNILPLFTISMAICYLYEKTQNILAPVIFHSLHNLISFSFFLVIKNLISS